LTKLKIKTFSAEDLKEFESLKTCENNGIKERTG